MATNGASTLFAQPQVNNEGLISDTITDVAVALGNVNVEEEDDDEPIVRRSLKRSNPSRRTRRAADIGKKERNEKRATEKLLRRMKKRSPVETNKPVSNDDCPEVIDAMATEAVPEPQSLSSDQEVSVNVASNDDDDDDDDDMPDVIPSDQDMEDEAPEPIKKPVRQWSEKTARIHYALFDETFGTSENRCKHFDYNDSKHDVASCPKETLHRVYQLDKMTQKPMHVPKPATTDEEKGNKTGYVEVLQWWRQRSWQVRLDQSAGCGISEEPRDFCTVKLAKEKAWKRGMGKEEVLRRTQASKKKSQAQWESFSALHGNKKVAMPLYNRKAVHRNSFRVRPRPASRLGDTVMVGVKNGWGYQSHQREKQRVAIAKRGLARQQ